MIPLPKPRVWWGIPAALMVGLGVGRGCAPARTVEVEAKVDRSLQAQLAAAEQHTAELEQQLQQARSQVRVQKIYIRKPDGTIVQRETSDSRSEASTQTSRETAAAASSKEGTVKAFTESSQRVTITERALPDWRFGLDAGQVLGEKLKPSYGGTIQRRLWDSPLSGTLSLNSRREIRLGLNWEL